MKNKFNIVAYLGVHNTPSLSENFARFKDCGFTTSIWNYSSIDDLIYACNLADDNGINIIGDCPELHANPENTAAILKTQRGFLGYFIKDEPSVNDMSSINTLIDRIKSVDDTHLFYVNLFPYYCDDQLIGTKTKTYQEYLDAAKTLECYPISFDYYPVTTSGLRSTWFDNLNQIRILAKETGKPFWGFVLSTAHGVYPTATIGSMYLQAYTNLAYGAQSIEYFTYQTPGDAGGYTFYDGPIEKDLTTQTQTWGLCYTLNEELQTISPIFDGCEVLNIHHSTKCLWWHKIKSKYLPDEINKLTFSGCTGGFMSVIKNNGHKYAIIVNKNYNSSVTVKLSVNKSVKQISTLSMTELNVNDEYTLSPGRALILKLN